MEKSKTKVRGSQRKSTLSSGRGHCLPKIPVPGCEQAKKIFDFFRPSPICLQSSSFERQPGWQSRKIITGVHRARNVGERARASRASKWKNKNGYISPLRRPMRNLALRRCLQVYSRGPGHLGFFLLST